MSQLCRRHASHALTAVSMAVLGPAFVAVPAPARAETQVCTVVSSLPAYITDPGHYCLEQDFDFSAVGTAINILSDNVVLDCNDHRVTRTGTPGGYAGVHVHTDHDGVVVRNCTIDGFGYGIFVQSSSAPGATGNLVEGNTVLRSDATGISAFGSNNRIERNRVSGNTGNLNGNAQGISLGSMENTGISNAIRDNVISDFKPAASPPGFSTTTMGISFGGVHNTEVTGNTISGLYAATNTFVEAIVSQGTSGSIIARNTVLSAPPLPAPLDGAQGYGVIIYGPAAGNVCRDNVVGHFTYANLSGCVDSANTDF